MAVDELFNLRRLVAIGGIVMLTAVPLAACNDDGAEVESQSVEEDDEMSDEDMDDDMSDDMDDDMDDDMSDDDMDDMEDDEG